MGAALATVTDANQDGENATAKRRCRHSAADTFAFAYGYTGTWFT
jgi:hypothetical protein